MTNESKHILIVSPYQASRSQIAQQLAERGRTAIEEAETATEAIEKATTRNPRLVFMEICSESDAETSVTTEDAYQVITSLPTKPVIALISAMDSKSDRSLVERVDGFVYVVKPMGTETLDTILEHFL